MLIRPTRSPLIAPTRDPLAAPGGLPWDARGGGAPLPANTVAPVLGAAEVGESPTLTAGTWTGSPTLTYSLEVDAVEVVAGDEAAILAYVYTLADEGLDAILYEIPDGNEAARVASNTVSVDPYDFAKYATPLLHLYAIDADTTVTGAGVSAWTDLAGVWTVAQGTDADRPAFLDPGVDFDVANTEALDLTDGAIAGDDLTLFTDLDIGSTGTLRFPLSFTGAGGTLHFLLGGTSDSMGIYDGNFRHVAIATTGRQKLRWTYAGGAPGSITIHRDGSSLGSAATGTVTPGTTTAARISESSTSAAGYCDLTLYRLILYPTSSLTAPQAADIEAHL